MAQLRQDYAQFVDRDAEIIAVGPEGQESFAQYWLAHEMPFVGLPDPQHTVAGLYGQEVRLLKLGRLPAQILVDKAGTVRYAHYGRTMADIPPNTELLALLDKLNAEDPAL
jgi:peroxiredoxin Q/BCP